MHCMCVFVCHCNAVYVWGGAGAARLCCAILMTSARRRSLSLATHARCARAMQSSRYDPLVCRFSPSDFNLYRTLYCRPLHTQSLQPPHQRTHPHTAQRYSLYCSSLILSLVFFLSLSIHIHPVPCTCPTYFMMQGVAASRARQAARQRNCNFACKAQKGARVAGQ